MGKAVMIQGTMSNVGKSVIAAGLCRVLFQDGYRVAPFKSQNMSYPHVTEEGLEIGRSQAVQAEAAGVAPSVYMNPILLKPSSDVGSEVVVNGVSRGYMGGADYFAFRKTLIPEITRAYEELAHKFDVIIIEGAGSPAEINLRKNDIVNMGLAEMLDAPVLLVGDIDPGGVFAQLAGTLMLLSESERERVKGLIINKFRGDLELLRPGLSMIEDITGKPVIGTIPYISVDIEDEDSLAKSFRARRERGAETDTAGGTELKAAGGVAYRNKQYDILADAIRASLDMDFIYAVINA